MVEMILLVFTAFDDGFFWFYYHCCSVEDDSDAVSQILQLWCAWFLGVVPACRSLDCVSVFASCVDDGAEVVRAISKEEGLLSDPTRRVPTPATTISVDSFRFAVPGQELLSFMGPGGSSVANGSSAYCFLSNYWRCGS